MASRLTTLIVAFIVVATLIAGIIARAQRDDDGPVDLIVYNGKVYPGGGSETFAEAIAIRGNTIFRVGSNREIKRLRRPRTTVVDAHGGAVLPGFNDAHVHFLDGSLGVSELNLLDATTADEIGDRLRAHVEARPEQSWVRGRGWTYTAFTGGLPTRQQLDAIVPDRPAYLVAYDGQSAWANTTALKAAGITRTTPNPANGVVVKDAAGEPTGVLKAAAMDLMRPALPAPGHAERLAALRAGIREAHRLGVTSVQNAGGTPEELALWDELREANDLKLRVYSAVPAGPGLTDAGSDTLELLRREYGDDPLLKAGAIRLTAGDATDVHTFTPEALTRIVTMLDARGWQVWIEASGDRAVQMSLDALEAAAKANPAPPRGRRHRIERTESIDPADVPRFARLGVIASMQPFQTDQDSRVDSLRPAALGPSRGGTWQSVAAAGGRLAFGSDWPAVPLDPRAGLQVVVNPLDRHGEPGGEAAPDERIRLTGAIDAYTSGPAYASFDDQRKGTLARGMLADIVILTADIFDAPPQRLLDAHVAVTIFDGKIVYDRSTAATE